MSICLQDYEKIVGADVIEQLRYLAKPLKGRKVLHINSTKEGGGVAEILKRMIPLLNELGINARWEVVTGDEGFFEVTKAFHNALQGADVQITREMIDTYIINNYENSRRLDFDAEFIFIHDPQPAALIRARKPEQKWIWRCHIDLSNPDELLWDYLKQYIIKYDASIFSISQFARPLPIPQFRISPSIDPLSEKNKEISDEEINNTLKNLGISLDKPMISQISRFDRFKDPVGVIKAFELVKKHVDCKLILAGGGAIDDPEGELVLEEIKEAAGDNKDIYILELPPTSDIEINAIQRASTLVIQKSLREGFGLTVTEAQWKSKPVIGGATGGIIIQIQNKFTGYLVHSIEGTAYRIRYLLRHPDMISRFGKNAKEYARRNFLLTRHLRDYLLLMLSFNYPNQSVFEL